MASSEIADPAMMTQMVARNSYSLREPYIRIQLEDVRVKDWLGKL